MPEDVFAQLAATLRERLAVIANRALYESNPETHLDQLRAVSERITALAAALPQPVEGDFAHYLHRASYGKALAWLEARGK